MCQQVAFLQASFVFTLKLLSFLGLLTFDTIVRILSKDI